MVLDDNMKIPYTYKYMKLLENLISLGLSKNEASIYLALLENGLTQAGPLVKTTKLHRMLVYEALDRLSDAGLISIVHKKNIKLFQASDPSTFIEKSRQLHDLASALVPELRKKQKNADTVTVRTLVGQEGFITNLQEVIESAARQKNKTMAIIGGARDSDFYETIGDWYDSYLNLLRKHQVKKLLLAPESYSEIFNKKFAQEDATELCTLPHGLSSPTYTRITEEMVTIELYQPHITIIQIRNKAVARGYLDSFELLWKSAQHNSKR